MDLTSYALAESRVEAVADMTAKGIAAENCHCSPMHTRAAKGESVVVMAARLALVHRNIDLVTDRVVLVRHSH